MMNGCGPGMMGSGLNSLDLTKDQRDKIYAIHRDLREKQFALMTECTKICKPMAFETEAGRPALPNGAYRRGYSQTFQGEHHATTVSIVYRCL
jgi:hypothetical protein